MRTALISALKRTGEGNLRADEPIAGRVLIDWQVDLALDLGCERIVCLCEAPSPVVIALQRRVEKAGFAFHTARGPLQLAGLVRDEDELVVLLDGLFVSGVTGCELLAPKGELVQALWTLPANHALSSDYPEDFERIDRVHNWAGLAAMPGKCMRELANLPGDGESVSLLLRLALQAGTQRKPLPIAHLEGDDYFLVTDRPALERREAMMVASSLPAPQWEGPANAIANSIVRRTAPHWLGSAPEIGAVGAVGLGAIGAALAGFGNGVVGLAVASLAAFIAVLSTNARQMRRAIGGRREGRVWSTAAATAMIALAILTLILASSQSGGWLVRASIPVFAIGLAMIAGQDRDTRIGAFWRDTSTHLVLFAIAAGFGHLQEGVIVFALVALLQLALRSTKQ